MGRASWCLSEEFERNVCGCGCSTCSVRFIIREIVVPGAQEVQAYLSHFRLTYGNVVTVFVLHDLIFVHNPQNGQSPAAGNGFVAEGTTEIKRVRQSKSEIALFETKAPGSEGF